MDRAVRIFEEEIEKSMNNGYSAIACGGWVSIKKELVFNYALMQDIMEYVTESYYETETMTGLRFTSAELIDLFYDIYAEASLEYIKAFDKEAYRQIYLAHERKVLKLYVEMTQEEF